MSAELKRTKDWYSTKTKKMLQTKVQKKQLRSNELCHLLFARILVGGFAGGIYDAETKLVRFGARDYDPGMGRWSAKDLIGFAGGDTDVYAYAGNDPVNLLDMTGLDVWIEGPSAGEPGGHLSISVGDPNGVYRSFSYGVSSRGSFSLPLCLAGAVYEDKTIGGAIQQYLKTSPEDDKAIIWNLKQLVDGPNPFTTNGSCYTFGNVCRDFAREVWSAIKESGVGKPSNPPATIRDNAVGSDVPWYFSLCQK